MSTTKRLKEYLDFKKIPTQKAENECGLGASSISKQLPTKDCPEGKSIGSENLEKILNTYHDLSAEWLLRGTGSMLISDGINPEQVFKTLNMPPNSDKIIEVWMQFMDVTKGMQELYKQSR